MSSSVSRHIQLSSAAQNTVSYDTIITVLAVLHDQVRNSANVRVLAKCKTHSLFLPVR